MISKHSSMAFAGISNSSKGADMQTVQENDPDRIRSSSTGTLDSSTVSPTLNDTTKLPISQLMAERMLPQQQSLHPNPWMQQLLLQQQLLPLPFSSLLHTFQQPGVTSRFHQQEVPMDPLLLLSHHAQLQQQLLALDAATASSSSPASLRSSVGSLEVADPNSVSARSNQSLLDASNNRTRFVSNSSVSGVLPREPWSGSLSFTEQKHVLSKTSRSSSKDVVDDPMSDPPQVAVVVTSNKKGGKSAQKQKNGIVGNNHLKPKRPMSAYNVFFKEQREILLSGIPDKKEEEGKVEEKDPSSDSGGMDNTDRPNGDVRQLPAASKPSRRNRNPGRPKPHGKMGFEEMAKIIGHRWKNLNAEEKFRYQEYAKVDRQRYESEKAIWMQQHQETIAQKRAALEQSVDPTIRVRYFESGGGCTPEQNKNASRKTKKRRKVLEQSDLKTSL
jgi:hypothetical protein